MRVAIAHDYINEFGGAERVLEALSAMFPKAPIYTAYCKKDSETYKRLKEREIHESWASVIPFFPKLASPLRFLTPFIWGSLDLSKYDLVISSASWYVTKGFGQNQKSKIKNQKLPIEICYCHTPPRWLYGYKTSVELQKYKIVRLYALIVGHLMRIYDFKASQKVDHFIANSQEVAGRINKFYRRRAVVIYPPVSLVLSNKKFKKQDYYLILSRIAGSKGIEMAIEAAEKMGFKLKIAGASFGYYAGHKDMIKKDLKNVEFLGFVPENELGRLYGEAKGFLALAYDEDFGITPVESMLCGTPVIAFNGGGYRETVVDPSAGSGQVATGVLFDDYSAQGLIGAIKRFEILRQAQDAFDPKRIKAHAQKFSKERFEKEIKDFVVKHARVSL